MKAFLLQSRAVWWMLLVVLWGHDGARLRADDRASARSIAAAVGIDQHLNQQLPLDVELRDEAGNRVRLREFFTGKPVIVSFVYFRCPMLCNQVLNGVLKSSQGMNLLMGEDYHVVSISIDPRETPEMAAAKKENYVSGYRRPGADRGWHFLTADQTTIDLLTKTAGFRYVYQPESDQYAHASGIMVATPEGRLSHYFYGIDYAPPDLRLALVESSAGKIGNVVDQWLLLCFHYDPTTGKYGLLISRVMQIAGGITLAAIGGFLVVMFRREQRLAAQHRAAQTPPEPLPAKEALYG